MKKEAKQIAKRRLLQKRIKEEMMTNNKTHNENNWFIDNLTRLAKEHRLHCYEESCGISLMSLGLLLEKAGIKLTKNQWKEFL